MMLVSVIVPCYNEQETIELLLDALYNQTYPHEHTEVIIADGLSTDATRNVIHTFSETHPDLPVRIVDNPKRIIPAGLNRALEAAGGEYIIRLDAHSLPYPDYIEQCIADLSAGAGENVGGVWEIHPRGGDWIARGIAAGASHPLGVGDARYRYTDTPQPADTVPFGAFHRSLIDQVGPYDEALLTNEDYEFNVRVRKSGGRVWLDPTIRCIYFARPTLPSLALQYWRYGFWKARMLLRYPETLRWRQLSALLVLSLLGLSILAIWMPLARWLLVIEVSAYTLALIMAGIQVSLRKRDLAILVSAPLAIATMHIFWGSGFLWSLMAAPFARRPAQT